MHSDEDDDNIGNRIEPDEVDFTELDHDISEKEHPYTRLDPDSVIAAVESVGYFSDARILALNSYENRVYQVGIEDSDPVIIKFYRPQRWSYDQILEEHQYTHFLLDQEIPVVPPLTLGGNENSTLGEFDGFYFAIYPRQGGRAPELDNLDHLHQLGQFIGRIHSVGKSFPFKFRNQLSLKDAYLNVEFLLKNNFIPFDLSDAYHSITRDILNHLDDHQPDPQQHRFISLHGDCHRGNVLWRDDRPHFLDFDDAISGPAVQDIWMMLSGDLPNQQKQLLEILEGYEMFMPFNLAELNLIEPLRAMRVLHFNAWLARRWNDPAFPKCFPWFNTDRYWSEHILELKELMSALREPVIELPKV